MPTALLIPETLNVPNPSQVINKAIAAELIFVATANLDAALYTEGW